MPYSTTKKISIPMLADILLALSVYLYSYRGNVGAIVALISFIIRFSNGKIRKPKLSNTQFCWVAFIAVFAVIDYLVRNLNYEFYVFVGYIIAISCILFLEEDNYYCILKHLYAISIFVALTVIVQFISPGLWASMARFVMPSRVYESMLRRGTNGYITGLTREVSYAALFLVFGFFYKIFMDKGKYKNYKAIIWLILLFITGKKAQPVFALIAVFMVSYLQSKNIKKHMKAIFGLVLFTVIIYISYPIWSKMSSLERIVSFVEGFGQGQDINGLMSGRIVIYTRAIELWSNNRFIGIGWENFRNLGAYGGSEYTTWFKGFDVHNCYLQILCESGIIGLCLFTVLFSITIYGLIIILRKVNFEEVKFSSAYFFFFWLLAFSEPCLYTDAYVIILFISLGILFTKKRALQ